MTIQIEETLSYWNYFLALESDMERLSRYVEFTDRNFGTYSIELAHLLLAACSEVGMIAEQICAMVAPQQKRENMYHYRCVIKPAIPTLSTTNVTIPRYGVTLTPWENWGRDRCPTWWDAYNNVKHHRADHFADANLRNTLHAMAGLLLLVLHFYRRKLLSEERWLKPVPALFHPPEALASIGIFCDVGNCLAFSD